MLYNKHTCRFGESGIGRTEGGWKFPELTERSEVSSGNFQPPEVCPIPDSPNLQVCLVFIPCHFAKKYKRIYAFLVYNFLFGQRTFLPLIYNANKRTYV